MKTGSSLAIASMMAALAVPAHADTATLINAGFENSWTSVASSGSDGYVVFNYGPSGPNMGWTFTGGGGVAASYTYLHAYEGSRFALLQLQSGLSQSFNLASASPTTTLDFALALRPGYRSGQTVSVFIDGVEKATYSASSTAWTLEHANLGNLTAGSHLLAFKGNAVYTTTGDTTAYLDAVKINVSPVPEPETYAMMMAGLSLLGFMARPKKAA